jgi:hypothetical protein
VVRGLRILLLAGVLLVPSAVAGAALSSKPLVPRGDYLAANEKGRFLVLSPHGKVLRRFPRISPHVQSLDLAPDRRSAYVSVYVVDQPPELYEVSFPAGSKNLIANGINPVVSPDGTKLAYVRVESQNDIRYRTALVIRDLQTAGQRVIPLAPVDALGTPPDNVINWSPDGESVALFAGQNIRVVNVATATSVQTEPSVGNDFDHSPVFLDRHRLVVLANCCIGTQQLVAVDLGSGARSQFARIGAPDEQVRRLKGGALLVVTALQRLVTVRQGRVHKIAKGIVAASP